MLLFLDRLREISLRSGRSQGHDSDNGVTLVLRLVMFNRILEVGLDTSSIDAGAEFSLGDSCEC